MNSQRLRPLALALVGAVASAPFLLGGWKPRWAESSAEASISAGALIAVLWPIVLPIALLACGAAGLAAGLRGLRQGVAFLCGSAEAGRDPAAHRALAAASQAALGSGLLLSLVAMLHMFQITASARHVDDYPSPAELAQSLTIMLVAPLCAMVLGRLVLAPASVAAAIAADVPERARRSAAGELALFALIVPVSTAFFMIITPPTL